MVRRIDFDMYKTPEPEKPVAGFLVGATVSMLSKDDHLQSVISMVEKKESAMWISEGNWSMHQLLLALLNIAGKASVFISSYAMSETAARMLASLKRDNMIERLSCVLDNRVDVRSPGSLQLIQSVCDGFALIATHAKVTVIMNDHWHITVIGSANYTENVRYESGVILLSPELALKQFSWIQREISNAAKGR